MSWTKNTNETKTYEERKQERLVQIMHKAKVAISYMCLGIWGEPKSAKSAIAMDILSDEDIKNDMKVYVFDFDNRAIDVKRNHYDNIDNIIVDNPIVRKDDSLVDFDATMENARTFYEMALECLHEGKLKAVIVDGADKLLTDVCETKMREKHKMDADTVIKQPPYVWGDRNTPYKNFLHKQILEMPCHRIVIAHSKDKYAGNPNPVGVEANWHSTTEDIFTATIRTQRTLKKGGAEYTALFEASARMPELIGTRRKVLSIKDGEIDWIGVKEIKTGGI
jgi:hypothetical protein